MKKLIKCITSGAIASFVLVTHEILHRERIHAQVFNGPGLESGIENANNVVGLPSANNPRDVVIDIITAVLDYVSLLAVIMVIIAGFYLVLSLGEDEKKDKAKKIIIYTLIGLVVLLLARVIVGLVTVYLAGELP